MEIDRDIIVGAIGIFGAILGSVSGALVSAIIIHTSTLRKERTRVLIEIEEYLDELWDLSNTLHKLKQSQIACSDDTEEKAIGSTYNRQIDKFFSIWVLRKRNIELDVYFNDPECSFVFREIESLYEKSRNKVESLSPFPIIDNDKLLKGLLDMAGEIYDLRNNLSKKLRLNLSLQYILFPTFSKWGNGLKALLQGDVGSGLKE